MKILLINSVFGTGSTGKIVEALFNQYCSMGHDVHVIVGRHFKNISDDLRIHYVTNELESKVYHYLSRHNENLYGGMPRTTRRIIKLIKEINPDVIHLHCLNGYFVNIYRLLDFLKKSGIKTILTNHADFMFTGNCGFALSCEKWRNGGCDHCDRVKTFNGVHSKDNTRKYFFRMKSAFSDFENLTVTNVSPWLTERSKSSLILGNYSNVTVFNPISDVFLKDIHNDPYKDNEGLLKILYVTPQIFEKEKGGYYLDSIAEESLGKAKFYVISGIIPKDRLFKNDNIIVIDHRVTQEELASFYKYADATLLLSKRETFSMVVAESLVCGTPVIGFRSGGPETIGIKEGCHFFDQGDINGIVGAISELEKEKKQENLSVLAKSAYSLKDIASQYLSLYESRSNSKDGKIKILHVIESFKKGGTESFVLNYMKALKDKNVHFDLWCPGEIDEDQANIFQSLGGSIYKGIVANRHNRKDAIIQFKAFLETGGYDIVHCNCNFESEPYIVAAKEAGNCKIIAHAHDTLVNTKRRFLKKVQQSVYRKNINKYSDELFACSYEAGCDIFGEKEFVKRGTIIKNIINGNGFLNEDEERTAEIRKKYNIPVGSFVIGNISRFESKKNQEFIIDVFEELLRERKNAILVLGGVDGGDEKRIQAMVASKGLNDSVRFIGPRNDVNDWLHIFDVYLFPSFYEGLGIAAIEAQCAGTHVLASPFIPKDTDLGIGLIEYISLSIGAWVEKLISFNKDESDKEKREQALKEKGFSNGDALLLRYQKLLK